MSINNLEDFNPTNTPDLYADYKFGESSFHNFKRTNYDDSFLSTMAPTKNDDIYTRLYYVPIDSVKLNVFKAEDIIFKTSQFIEEALLRKIYVDPYIDQDLEQAHFKVWQELAKMIFKSPNEDYAVEPILTFSQDTEDTPEDSSDSIPLADEDLDLRTFVPIVANQVNKNTLPFYICFDEIDFAEKYNSTACRQLVTEYYEAISLATFSYFYQLRKLLHLLLHEVACIKQSLLTDFGEQYDNESQQQIALQYDSWAKAAIHYTGRVTKIIEKQPERLPSAEVDQVTKKQAAQFQAFFAVRLNAVDSEINDLLQSLKRDLVDNCETFYGRYISPSLRMAKDISNPLEFDFVTTGFRRDNPVLAGELLVATNALRGNFVSIHADMVQRLQIMGDRIDGLLMLIHEKKRYSNFISQLSVPAVQKKQILKPVINEVFSEFFRRAPIDTSKEKSLISSHSDLDDLEEDHHPQYLLKDGGTITGNIGVQDGVTIDGIRLSKHAHTGADGSAKISILDIDYNIGSDKIGDNLKKPIAIKIEEFLPDIINGGVPVMDTVISIELDEDLNGYEYEILYTEIES